MADRQAKTRGCLLGGAVGDALGAAVEFDSLDAIRARHGAAGLTNYAPAYGLVGAITDDTQMTLFTAEALLRCAGGEGAGRSLVELGHAAYLRWLHTQGGRVDASLLDGGLVEVRELHSRRAPGTTCMSALQSGRCGTPARPINDSKGCGGVMRVAPAGLVGLDDPFTAAADLAAITHGHPSGYLSAGFFALLIRLLLGGESLQAAITAGLRRLPRERHHQQTTDAVEAAVTLARTPTPASPEALEKLGGGWVGEEALAISLYCALKAESFEHGVLLAVNHSGDADSTGSITGNILGVMQGVDAIPADWLERLELRDVITQLADDVCAMAHGRGATATTSPTTVGGE